MKAIVQTAVITVRIPEYADPEKLKVEIVKATALYRQKNGEWRVLESDNSADSPEINIAYLERYLTNPDDDTQYQTYTRVDYDII